MNKTAKSNKENKQASDNDKLSNCRSKIEPEEEPITIKSPPNQSKIFQTTYATKTVSSCPIIISKIDTENGPKSIGIRKIDTTPLIKC